MSDNKVTQTGSRALSATDSYFQYQQVNINQL